MPKPKIFLYRNQLYIRGKRPIQLPLFLMELLGVLLICVVLVGCVWGLILADSLSKEDYLDVCMDNQFSLYRQDVSAESESGVKEGYIATNPSTGSQMDFYSFKTRKNASDAMNRLVSWVAVHYGERGLDTTVIGGTWGLKTDEVFFKAVLRGNSIMYVICTDPNYMSNAEAMFSKALLG